MRRRFEQNIKKPTYAIHSDCIGGSIYIDNNYIGVIPDSGTYVFVSPLGGGGNKLTYNIVAPSYLVAATKRMSILT